MSKQLYRSPDELPHAVEHIENFWIPLPDGVRLAARAWIPESARKEPVPAVVEYIPYRKRDLKRNRDQTMHAYFAGHGYACLRVDMRGSGDADGVLLDEYLQQEQDDALSMLDWIAEQSWCDGSIGIMGLSWGGFNGLQIAARRPPQLKAVISLCSTDDRYADDVHYMGGCLLGDNLSWASNMFAKNALPPDPAMVGEKWRDMWFERLEANTPWIITWLEHQHRDAYWKHGSVCENFDAIQCPVMAVSGWADGYSNAVFRLMRGLNVPRQGLIGPWSHKYPQEGTPGPAIGFLQEALRWWDTWLKGEQTGIMDEPMLRCWMQDSAEPDTTPEFRRGRWIGEDEWPSPRISARTYHMSTAKLLETEEETDEQELTIQSPLSTGQFAGKWCSYASGPDMPYDQREEDGGALIFDSDPLDASLDILGPTTVELEITSNQPVAMIAVRLSDVAPDNKATRVTYGLLNLCHYESHERPTMLTPGVPFTVSMTLNDVAHRFLAGHKLRLSITTSYWPLAWAPPCAARLTITPGSGRLLLPVRPMRDEDAKISFHEPESAPPVPMTREKSGERNWRVIRDLKTYKSVLEVVNDDGVYTLDDIGTTVRQCAREWYSNRGNDFQSLRGETHWVHALTRERDGWDVRTETRTVMTCDATHFHIHATLDAFEGEQRIFERSWTHSTPRRCV